MIKTKINDLIYSICPIDNSINEDMSLKDDLGIDSLRIVELLVTIEDNFDITFDLTDLENEEIKTVSDIYNLTMKYITDGNHYERI